jgi:hypothetical protein
MGSSGFFFRTNFHENQLAFLSADKYVFYLYLNLNSHANKLLRKWIKGMSSAEVLSTWNFIFHIQSATSAFSNMIRFETQ